MSQTLAAQPADETMRRLFAFDADTHHYRPSFFPLVRPLADTRKNPNCLVLSLEIALGRYAQMEGLQFEQEMRYERLADLLDLLVVDVDIAAQAKAYLAIVRKHVLQ